MPEYVLDTSNAGDVLKQLDAFTLAYVEAAMWTLLDDDGNDCDDLGLADIAPESIARMIADCKQFREFHSGLLSEAGDDAQNGHDFWLTRNGHGVGFWDRGYDDAIGDALSEAAQAFGESDGYIGDDGLVYFE